jgi:hypothetical protein
MERDRGFKIIALIALVVAIVGLSFGYAAWSTTLTISGSAKVNPATWDVHFAYKSGSSLTPTIVGNASSTGATLTATAVSGFDITLKAPGDSVTYNWLVKNEGSIDAKLKTYNFGSISCAPATGSTATQAEATAVCNDLTYSLTYADGSAISVNDTLAKNTGSKELKMTLSWKSTSTATPSDDIKVTVATTTMIYEQN